MPRNLLMLLPCAFLLSGCRWSTPAYVSWPTPPESKPCPVQLLPEKELTRPETEARLIDAEMRIALCDVERRKLLDAWPRAPKPEPDTRRR